MNQNPKPNIFNISSEHNFFESLYIWLLENFSDQLSETKILLPNQRSCRHLQQLFLEKSTKNSAIILPKIKAISDISYEDFFDFLPNNEIKPIIAEILQAKPLSKLEYLFFITNEIQKLAVFGDNLNSSQALGIATSILNLFDEIENEEVDLEIIDKIDDSNLSLHRQVTLEFLKNFYFQIKNSFIKQNIFFASSYRNFVVEKYIAALEKFGSKNPIIVAGSTGSLSFGRKLIKAILAQNNGHVILYGLNFDGKTTEDLPQNHPQFLLNSLLKFLQVDKKLVEEIAVKPDDKGCKEFLSLLFLPQEKTIAWQNAENLNQKLSENLKIIACKNELQEAKIIATILAENYDKKSAVIINNQKLYTFLKAELQRLGLEFNDTINQGVLNCQLIEFIFLTLELIESDFASSNLLAITKHPLFFYSNKENILPKFEKEILRQDRTNSTIEGIYSKLKTSADQSLKSFFTEFYSNFSNFKKLNKKISIAKYVDELILLIENLTKKSWQNLLQQENAEIELFEFFCEIKNQQNFIVDQKNFLHVFKTLLSQVGFFNKTLSSLPIQLLSPIEARLLNHDLTIVSSLNEGSFPQIESENWLGRKIRKDLKIDKKLIKIGQNAYDFCNYLNNKSVVLTYSLSNETAPLSPSLFLLKLQTLAKKLTINFDDGKKYHDYLQKEKQVKANKSEQPRPKPEKNLRPKKLAITDISKLISNPYQIYAKKILKLKKLQEIDYQPSYAEFGSFVHKALEEFVKNNFTANLDDFKKIFEEYFIADEAKLIWWPKFENIFNSFLKQEAELKAIKNYTEIPVKMVLNNILINGKIDRVVFDQENAAAIYDYKTGQIPTKISVTRGLEPQLTIAALMLVEGAIESEMKNIKTDQLKSINYWKLGATSEGKITKMVDGNEEMQILIESAKSGLTKLLEYFSDENNGYICLDTDIKNDYWHLSRNDEWQTS